MEKEKIITKYYSAQVNETLATKTPKFLLGLLRDLEYSGQGKKYDYGEFAPACPICGGQKPLNDGDDHRRNWVGHTDDCKLRKAIVDVKLKSKRYGKIQID